MTADFIDVSSKSLEEYSLWLGELISGERCAEEKSNILKGLINHYTGIIEDKQYTQLTSDELFLMSDYLTRAINATLEINALGQRLNLETIISDAHAQLVRIEGLRDYLQEQTRVQEGLRNVMIKVRKEALEDKIQIREEEFRVIRERIEKGGEFQQQQIYKVIRLLDFQSDVLGDVKRAVDNLKESGEKLGELSRKWNIGEDNEE